MKRKSLYILLAVSISCTMFSACNKNDSVETVNTVEETTSIVETETVTEEMETTTVEEVESTVEVETEKEEESTEEVGTEISPLAGTTSKHGYVYPADYITGGPKVEDQIGDVEMAFDMGWITEEEYQHDLEFFKKIQSGKISSAEDILKEIKAEAAEKVENSKPSTGGGSSQPGGSGTGGGSSNPPGTPGYDPATYIPEGNTYHPDGRICY